MRSNTTTIFDVLDNLFGYQHYPSVERLSNRQIIELRHRVLSFYRSHKLNSNGERKASLYLGSFLSSPPFLIDASPYISSALLCSESIILFDPLHYWFCQEQYQRQRLESASAGWRNIETGKPDFEKTKHYLGHTFPWLYSIRTLVEAGLIVLFPAEQVIVSNLADIDKFVTGIVSLSGPIEKLARKFSPIQITVDDNRKGFFAFQGGNAKLQIQRAIYRGIEQFARDTVIANYTGAIYTAPFPWEQHLGKTAFNNFVTQEYHATIVEGIKNLRLPILAKLTPDVLVRLHQDSGYVEFRAGLHEALRNINAEIGSADFEHRVAEIERDVLLPKVESVHKEVSSGRFTKATSASYDGVMTLVQNFAGNLLTGLDVETSLKSSGAAGLIAFVSAMLKRRSDSSDRRIWLQLLPNKSSLSIYGSPLILKKMKGNVSSWKIEDQPSNRIVVSGGIIKFPWEASEVPQP
ncbi:MAG: hypothetical protein M3R24_05155 [Chloroflexota bacterium]|nr:hypothetical protein [Chloroflexota bacterium]